LASVTFQLMFWFGERHSPASPPRLRNVGYGRAIALAAHWPVWTKKRLHIGHTYLAG